MGYYEELGLLLYNGDKETVSGTLEITERIFFFRILGFLNSLLYQPGSEKTRQSGSQTNQGWQHAANQTNRLQGKVTSRGTREVKGG